MQFALLGMLSWLNSSPGDMPTSKSLEPTNAAFLGKSLC